MRSHIFGSADTQSQVVRVFGLESRINAARPLEMHAVVIFGRKIFEYSREKRT